MSLSGGRLTDARLARLSPCDPLKIVFYQAACADPTHTIRTLHAYLKAHCGLSFSAIAYAIVRGIVEVEGLRACMHRAKSDGRVRDPLVYCLKRLRDSRVKPTEEGWDWYCGEIEPVVRAFYEALPSCLDPCRTRVPPPHSTIP
jgi:hypothetical protein